jgi:hypothetical protein
MFRWRLILLGLCVPCAAQLNVPPFQPDFTQLAPADLREVLDLLCPGQENGCRVCPQATKAAGAGTDGSVESALRGHFLKPDSDDLLVTLAGCGASLLTHSASGWFVNHAEGLPHGQCRKIARRDGRDGLVCYAASSTNDREDARLAFYVVGEQPAELLGALDNTGGACDAPKGLVVQSAIQEVKFTPATKGKLTLTISARCRRGPLSAQSRQACARGPGFENIGPAAAFRTFRMTYSFDGEAFSLAPASRASKHAYDVCSAELR